MSVKTIAISAVIATSVTGGLAVANQKFFIARINDPEPQKENVTTKNFNQWSLSQENGNQESFDKGTNKDAQGETKGETKRSYSCSASRSNCSGRGGTA